MPLGLGNNVSHFTISAGIGMRNENIWRVSDESLNNADHLFPRLASSEHHLRKSLARGTGVIHPRVTDVFVMKIADSACGFPGFQLIPLISRQELFQRI